MAGVNKVILVGNLGADPEYREFDNGGGVTKVRLATSDSWTDKNGEKQESTEWHNVEFFGKQADIANEYLSKGRQIYVEGKIQTRTYEKDGETRYAQSIRANSFQFLGSKNSDSSSASEW